MENSNPERTDLDPRTEFFFFVCLFVFAHYEIRKLSIGRDVFFFDCIRCCTQLDEANWVRTLLACRLKPISMH